MSALWLKLITVLCLSCIALSGPGSSGVVWRDVGGSLTIQCRPPKPGQEYMYLKKGLSEELEVLLKDGIAGKNTTDSQFRGRLEVHGVFPVIDILIKNLTSDDTGPYWCTYKMFDTTITQNVEMKGTGSVLLVVTDKPEQCEPSNHQLILVSVVICAAVLLSIIIFFFILFIRKTKMCTTKKPRRVATNDVYEDMRGTIRR